MKLKQLLIIGSIILLLAFAIKSVLTSEKKGFNVAAANLLGKPGDRKDANADASDNSDDFWTSGKFKW